MTLFPNKELKIWSIVQYLWCHKLQACLEMSSNTVSNKTKTNTKMEILNHKNLMLIKSRYLKTVTAMIFFVKTCRVLMSLTKYGTLPSIYSEWSRPRSSETLSCVDCDARDNFHKKIVLHFNLKFHSCIDLFGAPLSLSKPTRAKCVMPALNFRLNYEN